MSTIYVKRGAVVSADPFDPARSDQGAERQFSVPGPDDPADGTFVPVFLAATIVARGRVTSLHPGDMIFSAGDDVSVLPASKFSLIFEPLDNVVQNDAIVQTGGSQ